MLRIKAKRADRHLVQELAAEYISGKFHELKGDYEVLMARVDVLEASIKRLSVYESLDKKVEGAVADAKKIVEQMQTELRESLEASSTFERLGEVEHRLGDVENHLGI